jgi:hypothetical protein
MDISSSIPKLLEFQRDAVNYMNQNANIAIGKIDNMLNFVNDNHTNFVISIQKITEAFQLNQDDLKENQSLLEGILKEMIQGFTLLPTLIKESTNKLGNPILNSFQKQFERLGEDNVRTIRNLLQVQFSSTFDNAVIKTPEILIICDKIEEQISKIFAESSQETSSKLQQLHLSLKGDIIQQLMNRQREILMQLKMEKDLIKRGTDAEIMDNMILKHLDIQEHNINCLKTYLRETMKMGKEFTLKKGLINAFEKEKEWKEGKISEFLPRVLKKLRRVAKRFNGYRIQNCPKNQSKDNQKIIKRCLR